MNRVSFVWISFAAATAVLAVDGQTAFAQQGGGVVAQRAPRAFAQPAPNVRQLSQRTRAQFGPSLQRQRRPSVSPYLGLFAGGGDGSNPLNYYGLVRPNNDIYRFNQARTNQINSLRRDVDSGIQMLQSEQSMLNPTGHSVAFFDRGRYFPRTPRGRR
jgi:hypothetical protein